MSDKDLWEMPFAGLDREQGAARGVSVDRNGVIQTRDPAQLEVVGSVLDHYSEGYKGFVGVAGLWSFMEIGLDSDNNQQDNPVAYSSYFIYFTDKDYIYQYTRQLVFVQKSEKLPFSAFAIIPSGDNHLWCVGYRAVALYKTDDMELIKDEGDFDSDGKRPFNKEYGLTGNEAKLDPGLICREDGSLILPTDESVICLNQKGELEWHTDLSEADGFDEKDRSCEAQTLVDGFAYFAYSNAFYIQIDAESGDIEWSMLADEGTAQVLKVTDGKIEGVDRKGVFIKISIDDNESELGRQLLPYSKIDGYNLERNSYFEMTIAPSGRLFAGSRDGRLVSFDLDGRIFYEIKISDSMRNIKADGRGHLLVSTKDRFFNLSENLWPNGVLKIGSSVDE